MSLFEKIQSLAKEKGLTIKQIERECGLANATIRRWETQNPSFDSVLKVSTYLQVSLDYLAGTSSPSTTSPRFVITCDGIPLTESEADLVAMYRLIDEPDRKSIFDFTKMKYEQKIGEKESIYSTYSDVKEQQKSGPTDDAETAHDIA